MQMEEQQKSSEAIYNLLVQKAALKQKIFDNTLTAFKWVKEIAQELEAEFNEKLKEQDKRILLKYRNVGMFQTELKVAGDMLIFYMHSNVFQFDRDHRIWKTKHVKQDYYASYVGIISIYNFLADSFRYSRNEDMGYLIARIFINKDNSFFVEGKRQRAYLSDNLPDQKVTKEAMRDVIESAILYSLQFDLLVPPYDSVKVATVEQMLEARKIGVPTGKRVGFSFRTDDIDIVDADDKIYYTGG